MRQVHDSKHHYSGVTARFRASYYTDNGGSINSRNIHLFTSAEQYPGDQKPGENEEQVYSRMSNRVEAPEHLIQQSCSKVRRVLEVVEPQYHQ